MTPQQTVASSLSSPEAVKEFRAQRNLYITFMALFLWFVIKRLVVLISNTAYYIDECELHMKEITALREELNVQIDAKITSRVKHSADTNGPELIQQKNFDEDSKEEPARSRSRVKKEM